MRPARLGVVDSALTGCSRIRSVAGGPNRALVVYEDNNGEANANEFHITARLFNGTTNTFGSSVLIADAGAGHTKAEPDVAYIGDGRFVIVYDLDTASIFARIYNSDTGALSPEIAVSTAAATAASMPRSPPPRTAGSW